MHNDRNREYALELLKKRKIRQENNMKELKEDITELTKAVTLFIKHTQAFSGVDLDA